MEVFFCVCVKKIYIKAQPPLDNQNSVMKDVEVSKPPH